MPASAAEYVNTFSHSGKKVTDLSRISGLLQRLGNPQNGQKFVHIAGTNGKGSTLEYMSCILIEAGYRTGQFTSPYIETYNDRIRINGRNIPDSRLDEICRRVKKAVSHEQYSQFEITFAAALIYFLEENCDIVFLETGIGGLLDATNIIESPLLSVITSVSLDHTALLGNSVSEIACQKAGIIKKDCPSLLSADNLPETYAIVKETAKKFNSILTTPSPDDCNILNADISGSDFLYKNEKYHAGMCGEHQVCNSITAIEGVDILKKCGYDIPLECIKKGLEKAKVKLRIELLGNNPTVIADGGHNISGIDSLMKILNGVKLPLIGIFGMVEGKNPEYAGKKLSGVLDYVICTDDFTENTVKAPELQKYFSCPSETAGYREALEKAVRKASEKGMAVIVCGSLYLASAVRNEYTSSLTDYS